MFTIFSFFYTLFSQWDFLPMGNSGRFSLGKPAATESRYPPLINYKVHAGPFRVSVTRRLLTWPTGCLMCVRVICMRSYTHGGWAHRQRVSTTFLNCYCAPEGVRTSGHGIQWVLRPITFYQLSHSMFHSIVIFICVKRVTL